MGVALWLMVALVFAVANTAAAEVEAVDPTTLVGGDSRCPTPSLVWERLVPLVPSEVLAERFRVLGGPTPPVQIVDLDSSFRVLAGHRVREYQDVTRDCAKRAQFAAVFVAVAAGADPASLGASPAGPTAPEVVRALPALPIASAPPARARLDVGAVAGMAFGGGDPTIAPGLALRIGVGQGPLIPVAALGVAGPADGDAGGVAIRQWRGTADVGLRSRSRAIGPLRADLELGAVVELLSARPTNLTAPRTQVSLALGARAAVGLLLVTRGRLSPFVLLDGAWFPRPPERFALPAGDLGRAAPWNVSAIAGVSWGLL
jgi:hypothetical protein